MVATVAVMAPGEQPYRVVLPAAVRFTANNTVGERREHHLEELDGAITDRDGNVQLPDGSYLHAIELIPVHLPSESEAEKEVLLCVLDVLGLKKDCYRPPTPSSCRGCKCSTTLWSRRSVQKGSCRD